MAACALLLVFIVGPYMLQPALNTLAVPEAAPTPLAQGPGQVGMGNTLYIVSSISGAAGNNPVAGRVTVFNLAMQRESYSIKTGPGVDMIPSLDGSRLYIAAWDISTGTDRLFAVNSQTRQELWHTTITDRVEYILGTGPSALVISPDGSRLYVYSTRSATEPAWLQIIDTSTGHLLPDTILLPNFNSCGATIFTTPPHGEYIYANCKQTLAINISTRQVEQESPITAAGSVLLPDGRSLYIVYSGLHADVIDTYQHAVVRRVDIGSTSQVAADRGLVALSADGMRLTIGNNVEGAQGTDTVSKIAVLNMQTGQEIAHFQLEQPVRQFAFAMDAHGKSIYAVIGSKDHGPADTIAEIDATNGQIHTKYTRSGEDIMRIFTTP